MKLYIWIQDHISQVLRILILFAFPSFIYYFLKAYNFFSYDIQKAIELILAFICTVFIYRIYNSTKE